MLVLVVAGESIVSMVTYLAEGDYRVVHALQVGGGGGVCSFISLRSCFFLCVCALQLERVVSCYLSLYFPLSVCSPGGRRKALVVVISLFLCFSVCESVL